MKLPVSNNVIPREDLAQPLERVKVSKIQVKTIVHDKYSTCCLKTVSEDGNPVDTYVCCGHGCAKPDSDGNGRGCK